MSKVFNCENQADHGDHRVEGGHEVPAAFGVGVIVRCKKVSADQGDDDDGNVDQEDRSPPRVSEKEAAQEWANGRADGCYRSPDANGGVALAGFKEGLADERKG